MNVSGQRIETGQSVEVSAPLRMGARSVSGVTAVFYDGDPQRGGKAFDVERIPHLRAGDTYEVKVRFRPQVCGAHQVFVSVGQGTPFEATGASDPVEVVCNQPPATPACSTLCQRAPQYYLDNLNRLPERHGADRRRRTQLDHEHRQRGADAARARRRQFRPGPLQPAVRRGAVEPARRARRGPGRAGKPARCYGLDFARSGCSNGRP